MNHYNYYYLLAVDLKGRRYIVALYLFILCMLG